MFRADAAGAGREQNGGRPGDLGGGEGGLADGPGRGPEEQRRSQGSDGVPAGAAAAHAPHRAAGRHPPQVSSVNPKH